MTEPRKDPYSGDEPLSDAKRLSRLLFAARESVEMFADIVEARAGKPDNYTRRLVSEIDQYRAERGWSPHGFGDEDDTDRCAEHTDGGAA